MPRRNWLTLHLSNAKMCLRSSEARAFKLGELVPLEQLAFSPVTLYDGGTVLEMRFCRYFVGSVYPFLLALTTIDSDFYHILA